MSLTEQWKRGELEDGHYYVKDDDLFVAEFFCGSFMVEEQIITINEVIAPVPTYEELQEQQATIDNLREIIRKKDEALITLKDDVTWLISGGLNSSGGISIEKGQANRMYETAQQALKEIEMQDD